MLTITILSPNQWQKQVLCRSPGETQDRADHQNITIPYYKKEDPRFNVRRILPETIVVIWVSKNPQRTISYEAYIISDRHVQFSLAKWVDEKLKPLSLNQCTVADTFDFTNEIHELKINKGEILVSYDVSSLFTKVPLDETIEILVNRAFSNNWFNTTHNLTLTRTDLVDLLSVATKGQLFQFDGALYEQTDGVAMGSTFGPLLTNVFMSSTLERQGKLPSFYR